MKKILIFLFAVLLLTGCGDKTINSPKTEVGKLFSNYNSLSSSVLVQLDSVMASEDLTYEQVNEYKTVLKRQYEDLKYKIVNEVVNDNNAVITVEIETYNLKDAIDKANEYINNNKSEFYNEDGILNKDKYWDYKLKQMKDTKERINYTIDLTLVKLDNEWILDDLLDSDRQKIHGLYSS